MLMQKQLYCLHFSGALSEEVFNCLPLCRAAAKFPAITSANDRVNGIELQFVAVWIATTGLNNPIATGGCAISVL